MSPSVKPTRFEQPNEPGDGGHGPDVLDEREPTGLPFTGEDLQRWAYLAALLVLAGAALTWYRRSVE